MALGVLISTTRVASAADMSHETGNFYKSDKVTMQKVVFKNQYNMKVVGNLFIPKGLKRNTKNPAIIVGDPMGAVKEQSANLYATKMAELYPFLQARSLFHKESEIGGMEHCRGSAPAFSATRSSPKRNRNTRCEGGIAMKLPFENKVALITGAGPGMGLATAKAFADAGASVALADIRKDAVRSVAEELAAAGHKALLRLEAG